MHISPLLYPVVSEKSTALGTKGKYVFYVASNATKVDIKNAFKALYGVQAAAVNILRQVKKSRMLARGNSAAKRRSMKKAIITTKAGKTVDVYKVKELK